jgi:hypothetical protein
MWQASRRCRVPVSWRSSLHLQRYWGDETVRPPGPRASTVATLQTASAAAGGIVGRMTAQDSPRRPKTAQDSSRQPMTAWPGRAQALRHLAQSQPLAASARTARRPLLVWPRHIPSLPRRRRSSIDFDRPSIGCARPCFLQKYRGPRDQSEDNGFQFAMPGTSSHLLAPKSCGVASYPRL